MSLLPDIHKAMADYLRGVEGIQAAYYPAPNSLAGNRQAVVYAGEFDLTLSMGQQYWLGESRAIVYVAPMDVPTAISDADSFCEAVVDAFAQPPGFNLGGLVDHCTVRRIELSRTFTYAGTQWVGAQFTYALKIRRFSS